ncbi:MAG: diguanylate cyclase, partial [Candidatus Omnitrophica bacterium]|nr:diguanylate cyclase [Candidatus Omnitrophota bacterium]
ARVTVERQLQRVPRCRVIRQINTSMARADTKDVFPAELSISMIKDARGKAEAYMFVCRDLSVTEQAKAAWSRAQALYRTLVSQLSDWVIETDTTGTILFSNKPLDSGKDKRKSLFSLLDKSCRALVRGVIAEAVEKNRPGQYDAVVTVKGKTARLSGRVIPLIDQEQQVRLLHVATDYSERRLADEQLQRKGAFERIIAGLSGRLMNSKPEAVEQEIQEALAALGGFAGADRAYIFLFRDKGTRVDNTYEWCAPGIKPQRRRIQNVGVEAFPWVVGKIKKKQTVHVGRMSDLPAAAAAERREWAAQRIKSLINVPVCCQGTVLGFLGFDAVRAEVEWPEDVPVLLQVGGDLLAGALYRLEMDRDLAALNKELLQTNLKLKQLALKDSLTGLYNHRYFQDVIESEYDRAQRQNQPLSIIMLDVDYFKSINDVYGHQFGDIVLKQLAKNLGQMVRKYDTVVRFGGEEFIIITPGANRKVALVLAQRLQEVIKLENFGNDQHKVKLKLSVAVTSFPDDKIRRGSDFIRIADFLLNKIKEMGGDRVYSYHELKSAGGLAAQEEEDEADVAHLKEKLEKLTKRSNQSLAEAIFAFAKTIEIKDHYTGEHVERTVHYAIEIAKSLQLPEAEVERIRQAALLHDLGKIGISEKILMKKAALTAAEYEAIKKHPQIGVDILRPIQFFHGILPLILHHHERWDGAGYPYRLKGEENPLGARIIAVADTFEALTADRRYRKACSRKRAIQEIKRNAGTQFDPAVVKVFVKIVEHEDLLQT